jgi:hypothetical protein
VRQGVLRHFDTIEQDIDEGLALRHDHGKKMDEDRQAVAECGTSDSGARAAPSLVQQSAAGTKLCAKIEAVR